MSEALEANKTLRGLIPICGYCKKIRDDQGYWDQVEILVAKHHGICPPCFDKQLKTLGLKHGRPSWWRHSILRVAFVPPLTSPDVLLGDD